jgi:hypothetical protein
MMHDLPGSNASPPAELGDERRPVGGSGEVGQSAAEGPYTSVWEYLQDERRRLDLRIGLRAQSARAKRQNSRLDALRGVAMSDEEAAGIVESLKAARGDAEASDEPRGPAHDTLSELDRRIERRLEATVHAGIELPLLQLCRQFGLTRLEEQCLIMALVPELDRRYERLYGYLQDDLTQRRPSVALVLDLLCAGAEERVIARRSFDPQAPLSKHGLLRIAGAAPEGAGSMLSRTLSLDDRMVDFLLGRQRIDARLDDMASVVVPDEPVHAPGGDLEGRIRRTVEAHWAEARPQGNLTFHLVGPEGSGRRELVKSVCRGLGIPLIIADLDRVAAGPLPFAEAVRLLAREAALLVAAICFERFDAVVDDPGKGGPNLHALLETTRHSAELTFLVGRRSWLPETIEDGRPFFVVPVSLPEAAQSRAVWEAEARSLPGVAGDVDWGSLASRFRFGASRIRGALALAGHIARWRSPDDRTIRMSDLDEACRAMGTTRMISLARKVQGRQTWEELILPPRPRALLTELCNEARHRDRVLGEWGFEHKLPLGRGLTALFCGPPGTGKTMAAQVIANELALDLYRIDLSQVVSKYIGETEKNLSRVFDDAESARAILFFDEADALFGKRSEVKDAHDRYANIEVGYLLQRMDEFDGTAILATNLRQNLDEAFTRRIRFIVEFPFPDEEQRYHIWQVTFPKGAPLGADVDFKTLAREVRLAGGHIRNIGLAAAFYAAEGGGEIRMEHLVRAAAREYEKIGKTWTSPIQGRAHTEITKGSIDP